MGDYCSSGLWNGKCGAMIDYDELNISNNLKKIIENWQDNWEIFNSFFLKDWSYKSSSDRILSLENGRGKTFKKSDT